MALSERNIPIFDSDQFCWEYGEGCCSISSLVPVGPDGIWNGCMWHGQVWRESTASGFIMDWPGGGSTLFLLDHSWSEWSPYAPFEAVDSWKYTARDLSLDGVELSVVIKNDLGITFDMLSKKVSG